MIIVIWVWAGMGRYGPGSKLGTPKKTDCGSTKNRHSNLWSGPLGLKNADPFISIPIFSVKLCYPSYIYIYGFGAFSGPLRKYVLGLL